MTSLTRHEALMKVRACFETEQAMADYFGVSQPTIWRWLNQSRQMPVENGHVIRAEALGAVSRHDLRPDIYPREEMVDRRAGDRFCAVDVTGHQRRVA